MQSEETSEGDGTLKDSGTSKAKEKEQISNNLNATTLTTTSTKEGLLKENGNEKDPKETTKNK